MSDPEFSANTYPSTAANPTIAHADQNRPNVGVCFSGGGSRALTCAWGQMSALRTLQVNGGNALDNVRYISSVSGGTWASVAYVYLPASIDEADFFLNPASPAELYLGDAPSGGTDLSGMNEQALGVVPQQFAADEMLERILVFIIATALNRERLDESLKWLWMYIVGKNVLEPFGLYDYAFIGLPWNYPGAKYFSLTEAYADQAIFPKAPAPKPEDFVFVRTDESGASTRPMLIANTNIIGQPCTDADMSSPLQIPIQVTPVSGGSLGANPCNTTDIVGGGSVESFAFTSELDQRIADGRVLASFPRRYSLVDITACSSAFFAEELANLFDDLMNSVDGEDGRVESLVEQIVGDSKLKALIVGKAIEAIIESRSDKKVDLGDLIPVYNNWPVAKVGDGAAANQATQFTDGGNLENTGVLGMLAQTDVETIVAFVNTSTPLEKVGDTIIAVAQASPLFGVCYDSASHQFKDYLPNGVNPFTGKTDPEGFLQVFDNSAGQFDALREGLYAANGSGAMSGPAFFQQSLSVVDNTLSGVSARAAPVTVLWVQNARVNNWQSQIVDDALKEALKKGQDDGSPLRQFANFPYYSTFTKVHMDAAETNALAQMWAWCVGAADSQLSEALGDLFGAE